MKLLWVRPGSDLALEILLFTGPAESPLGRFFVIEHGGSGRVARAVGPGAKRSSAPPFLRKKDFRRPDIINQQR